MNLPSKPRANAAAERPGAPAPGGNTDDGVPRETRRPFALTCAMLIAPIGSTQPPSSRRPPEARSSPVVEASSSGLANNAFPPRPNPGSRAPSLAAAAAAPTPTVGEAAPTPSG